MAWNTTCPPQMNRYHYECFLSQLESQCHYCTAYLESGIEKTGIFQRTVSSFDEMSTDENTDESNVTEIDDNHIGDEVFTLDDDNIDILFTRALNTLTSV